MNANKDTVEPAMSVKPIDMRKDTVEFAIVTNPIKARKGTFEFAILTEDTVEFWIVGKDTIGFATPKKKSRRIGGQRKPKEGETQRSEK